MRARLPQVSTELLKSQKSGPGPKKWARHAIVFGVCDYGGVGGAVSDSRPYPDMALLSVLTFTT